MVVFLVGQHWITNRSAGQTISGWSPYARDIVGVDNHAIVGVDRCVVVVPHPIESEYIVVTWKYGSL
jgi:hypothetical protein